MNILNQSNRPGLVTALERDWAENPRWKGILRPYSAESVMRLAGSTYPHFRATFAKVSAEKLYHLFRDNKYIPALGAMSGLQAVEQIEAGLKAIYVSGWQIAADANISGSTYPDLSLYPVTSAPQLVERIVQAEERRDQIDSLNGQNRRDWFAPIIADGEAGFGGPLNCYELVKHLIWAGCAGIHLEDQLSSLKKCGHMGGKVLVPISEFKEKLVSARLAGDVLGAPTLLIARTDAESAAYIRSDQDAVDQRFIDGRDLEEDGFYRTKGGLPYAVARSLEVAEFADLLWFETQTPDLGQAKEYAAEIHRRFPKKWLAYNCSPSFHWKKHMNDQELIQFQEKLGEMGYKFQFITLAGFHALNASMFELAKNYLKEGMKGFKELQEKEFMLEKEGFSAIRHQAYVGGGYFDELLTTIKGHSTKLAALKGSTEESQF